MVKKEERGMMDTEGPSIDFLLSMRRIDTYLGRYVYIYIYLHTHPPTHTHILVLPFSHNIFHRLIFGERFLFH